MMHWTPLCEATVQALAQTILHFVWQGFALWVLALCALHVVQATSAQFRYATFCSLLVLLAICPLVTFGLVFERPAPQPSIGILSEPLEVADGSKVLPEHAESRPASWASATAALVVWFERGRSWLVAIWLAGAALLASRLFLGVVGLAAIKRRRRALPPEFAPLVDRTLERLAFRRPPVVYVVDHTAQAMAVGLFKPLVLLPASWLSELPPQVIEAVVAHELAHLRRWDLAINLLQRVVECMLFFHPVVWWCSKRLRVEREICCDALAVGAIGNRAGYAKALTYLADQRIAGTQPLLAAGIGGPKMLLLERIRHVLDSATPRHGPMYGATCAAAGAAAASIVWLGGMAVFYAYLRSAPLEGEPSAAPPAIAVPLRVPPDNPDGTVAEEVKRRFVRGAKVARWGGEVLPNERNKTTLPPYTIEPPDILFIEAMRLVPKTRRIVAADKLLIQLAGLLPEGGGPNADLYRVDGSGQVNLGPLYGGKVNVDGLTESAAAIVIQKTLVKYVKNPQVSVRVTTAPHIQPITGEHLVAPDGTVNLGSFGQVYVAGMTLEESKAAIDAHLDERLDKPDVSVSVFAYNSKVYYVVTEGAGLGDTVARFPITGNETVLDALAQTNGLGGLSTKKIWIARPMPGGSASDTILPVDWEAITEGASTTTNYQILPGDRVFVSDEPRPDRAAAEDKNHFPVKQPLLGSYGYDVGRGRWRKKRDGSTWR